VIASTCLANGLELESTSGQATEQFKVFAQRYYVGFCEDALRCMFTCGFVPWRLRKLESGALVPETIPLGTFIWETKAQETTHSLTSTRRRKKSRHSTEALSYRIEFIKSLGIREEDVEIYSYVRAMSLSSTTLQTPLSGIVRQYKMIERSLARVEYADEWNSHAKMVCSYSASSNMYNMNEGNPIINDWTVPEHSNFATSDDNMPIDVEQNVYVRDAITEKVISSKHALHVPTVRHPGPGLSL
jgi:hypothetical protein